MLDRALAAGVEKVMLTGMSLVDVEFNLEIARNRRHQCFITIGIHPYHAAEADEAGEEYFQKLAQTIFKVMDQEPGIIAAYGELGLDYDHLEHASKDAQKRAFKGQLDLYLMHGFQWPLFLHCRGAFDDFVEMIKPYLPHLPRRGLVHSFVGTTHQMQTLVNMALDVSVNGFSFRDHDSLQMVRDLPLERLHIETDAPWGEIPPSAEISKRYLANVRPLPASKKRDKFEMGSMIKGRNECCSIERVAFVVAGLKGVTVEEVARQAWVNSVEMFRFE